MHDDTRRLLRIVDRETARLNRLTSDYLSYAGVRPPRREGVVLRELFEEIRDLLAASPHASVTLDLAVADGLAALGDPDQLRQVFWNLILNAVEAEPVDGCVRVKAEWAPSEAGDPDARVRVEVSDRGVGIPKDALERVFEPFFTTKTKGTGLGLATVHRMIEAHDGELAVSSEVGKGTTISVILERARA